MIDTHVHTAFSADSEASPRALIERAIAMGMRYIALTDHQENEFFPSAWTLDFDDYFSKMTALRNEYRDRITVAIGVEMGFAPPCNEMAAKLISAYPFDTVINSVHNIDGIDLYQDTFYLDKTKDEAYETYLKLVDESVCAPYPYTQIGHLGYIARYARYEDKTLTYTSHASTIDSILKHIADRGVILELNASTDRGVCATPTDILRRYYELGGRKVAPASDAHTVEKLGRKYGELVSLAKEIGFGGWTYALGGKTLSAPF